MARSRYFQSLSYLESTVLLHSAPKLKALRKWADDVGEGGSIALVIPLELDVDYLSAIIDALPVSALVIRTNPDFSTSAANRDAIRRALSEPGPLRVWDAGGLWELRAAAELAGDCGATVVCDPLAADPLDEAAETIAAQVAAGTAYFRASGLGSARKRFKEYDLGRLAELVSATRDACWVSFANAGAYKDAQALRKLWESVD